MEDIPLPLTEGSWAPLESKHHTLGRTASRQWYYICKSVSSLSRKLWAFRAESSHSLRSATLGLQVTHHGGAGEVPWDQEWSSGAGPQRQAPHTRLGRACETLAGAGLGLRVLPQQPILAQQSAPMAPAAPGQEAQLAPISWGRVTRIWKRTWQAAQE